MKNLDNKQKKVTVKQFIKRHIAKKSIVFSIIGIIIAALVILTLNLSTVDLLTEKDIEIIQKTSVLDSLKERIIILLLFFLSGWVSYFYIPVLAFVAYVFMLSGDLVVNMQMHSAIVSMLINLLPLFIDILSISIITAIGVYMCKITSKKYKYTQRTSFSFLDVKIQLYEMTKKKDKYEQAMAKKQEKIDNMEKNNVKIDYPNVIKIFAVAAIINLIICLITFLIN